MMSSDPIASPLTTLKIVVGAMIAGVVAFALIAFFLAGEHGLGRSDPDNQLTHILMLVLGALGLGLLSSYPLVRKALTGRLKAEWRGGSGPAVRDQRLLGQFNTLTIVGAAMAEGFALFATVIYLLSAHPVAFVGTAVGLVALVRMLPTAERLASFAGEITGQQLH